MNSFQTPPTGQHRKQLVSSDDPSVDTKMPAFERSADRSLVLLEKKIEKTKNMMDEAEKNEKLGRDSKLWNRLSLKLQQYKQEVADALERHSYPTTPIDTKPHSMGSAEESSPSPFPASPTSPHDSALTLQKKIKKVDKLMMDMIKQYGEEKAPHRKLYQKYRQKKDSYEQSLLGFEARVKDEAKKQLSAYRSPEVEESTQASPVKNRKAPKKSTKKMLGKDGKKKNKKGPKKKSARVAARRIVELEKEFQPQMHPKTKEIEDILRQEIKRNFIFSKLRDIDRLVGAFEITRDYQRDELVVEQNEVSHPVFFYIIISGQVEYEVDNIVVGTASIGNSFGEQGLLYSCPRKATVRATTTTKLCRLDQITFRYIMQSQSKFQEVWKQATRKVMAMNRLLGAVATMKMMEDDVCEETSSNSKEELSEEAPTLSELKIDEGFNSEYSVGFMDEMSSRRLSTRKSLTESCASFESYSRESMLGEGQFGEVWKVRPKMQELKDKEFALKIQAKDNVFRESTPGMVGTVSEAIERECEILSRLCHPFICEFVHNFEDEENIYLVMGLIRGEELWSIVHREMDDGEWESGIQESSAIFYGALIADALAYMHHLKICFRDLKPENVMIDDTGYPVLVDFGFAKHIPDGTTFTFCGTPQYTCPEIIGNMGHGFASDWWAFGIVVYEMITGENPFYYDGLAEMQLLEDIAHNEPEKMSGDYSNEAADFVSKLLRKDPEERLGSRGHFEIFSHTWLQSFDIVQGRNKQLQPPYIPTGAK